MNEWPYLATLGDSQATISHGQKVRHQEADRHSDRKETQVGAEIIPDITCSYKNQMLSVIKMCSGRRNRIQWECSIFKRITLLTNKLHRSTLSHVRFHASLFHPFMKRAFFLLEINQQRPLTLCSHSLKTLIISMNLTITFILWDASFKCKYKSI